jgi:hypothetical protein
MRPSYRASRSRTWRRITRLVGSCIGNSAGPRGDGIVAGAVSGEHSRSSQRLIGPNQIVEQVGGLAREPHLTFP